MAERSTLKPVASSAVPSLVPQGEQAGKPAMPLGRPFTLIGSRNRAHLHLLSSSISRNHAAIIGTDTGLYLRDLASRTGALVNGRKEKEADLHDGDIVQIGSFRFRYTDPSGTTRLGITPKPVAAMLEVDGTTLTPIDSRTILIGRRPTCDISLPEASVSNTHALVFEINGQRYIRDLGSRTGTLVNGKPIHHQELEFGDEIRIGDTQFRYVSAAAPPEEPAELEPAELAPEEDDEPIGLAFQNEHAGRVSAVDAIPEADINDLLPDEPAAEEEPEHDLIPLEPAASEAVESSPVAHSSAPETDDEAVEEREIDFEIAGSQLDLQNKLAETSRLAAHPEEPPPHAVTAPEELLRPVEDLGLDFLDETPPPVDASEAIAAELPGPQTPAPADYREAVEEQHEAGYTDPLALEAEPVELPVPEQEPEHELTAPIDPASPVTEKPVEANAAPPILESAEPELAPQPVEHSLTTDELSVAEPDAELSLEPEAPTVPQLADEEQTTAESQQEIPEPAIGPEPEEISASGEPVPLEPIDLSTVDFRSESPAADELPPPEIEEPPQVPSEPAPILDLATELPLPAQEESPAAPRGARRKKSRRRKQREELEATETAATAEVPEVPASQVPLAQQSDIEVTPESITAFPAETIATGDVPLDDTAAAELSSSVGAEVISPTDPTPDSAQELGDLMDEITPATDESEAPSADPLTDTAFNRIVEEFAGPESQPLVEQPASDAAAAFSDEVDVEPPMVAADAQATIPDQGIAPAQDAPLAGVAPAMTRLSPQDERVEFSAEEPVEQAITSDVSLDEVIELDSSALVEEPEPTSIASEPIEPFESAERTPTTEHGEQSTSSAAHVEESSATEPIQPAGQTADEPPEHSAARPVDPFFGMERDLGSFLGGIPLAMPTAPAAPNAPQPTILTHSEAAPPQHPEPTLDEMPSAIEDKEATDLTETRPEPSHFVAPELTEPAVSSQAAPLADHEVAGLDEVPDLEGVAEEKLDFSGEPDDLPPLDVLLADDSEPLDLFEGTADKLDALPDTIEPIGDLDGALADEKAAPRAPLPQAPAAPTAPLPAVESPRKSVGLPFGGSAATGTPSKPKVTPPPPPRTSPLRSFADNPFQLSAEAVPLPGEGVRSFSGEQPPNRGRVTSFEGLAMPPVREADVFSNSAFSGMNDVFFGRPAGETPEIPPAGQRPPAGKAQPGLASAAGEPVPPGAIPGTPAARKPRERKRDAIPPNRQALPPRGGQAPPARPLAQPSAANPPPPPGTPKRVPWWKKVRTLLPLMIVCLVGAWVGIIVGLPPRHRIEGALRFDGLESLTPTAQKQRVDSIRQLIRKPEFRAAAAENAKNSGAAGGFVDDPAAMGELSQADQKKSDYSEFNGGRQALVLVHSTNQADLDRLRMKAVLTALYSWDGAQRDTASTTRRQLDDVFAQVRDLERQQERENSKLKQLESDIRAAGGMPTPEMLQGPALWVSTLEERERQLWAAWQKAIADRAQRQAALEKAQAVPQGTTSAPADIDNDPEVRRLNASIDTINTRLRAARESGSGATQDVSAVLSAALVRLDDLLSALPDSNDPAVNAYLANARSTRDEVQQILNRTRSDGQTAETLRQQLSESSSAGQVTDPALRDLMQERDMDAHRYETAAGSGLAEEATKIKGVVDDLDRKIEARRKAIDGSVAVPASRSEQESLAQVERDRQRDGQRIRERLSRLEAAAPQTDAIPAAAREQLAPVFKAVSIAAAAADRFAAPRANPALPGDLSKLEAQLASAQSQLEQKRKELADTAAGQLSEQDRQARDAALAQARLALAKSDTAADQAATAYNSNRKLLSVVRELADERGQIAAVDQKLQLARQDLEQRQKTANVVATLVPPDDSSVSVSYGQDNRLIALGIASLFIVGLFGIMMWMASSRPRPDEIPFAGAVAVAHDVPGHRPDDFAAADVFDHDEREPIVA